MANEYDHLEVQFFTDTKQNKRLTLKEGRPIFKDIEKVRIRIAGDKGTLHVAPAHEKAYTIRDGMMGITSRASYAEMFPEQYKAFKAGQSQAVSGTPIDEAPFLTMANRAELKGLNVFTVEALAGLEKLDKLGMNGERWRDHARAYLKRAEGAAIDGKLLAENEAMKRDLEVLQEQMKQLLARKTEASDDEDAPAETSGEIVEKAGPFFGYDAKMLRAFIKEKTDAPVKGNPKLATLLSMAEEALEMAD